MRLCLLRVLVVCSFLFVASWSVAQNPNIVVIYVDDLGYGDVSCYGARRVSTPNIDQLAAEGCRFLDGHSSAATCTPSRYSLLTGNYAWRKRGTGIAPGDATSIITPGTPTVASLLQKAGYRSAVIGKWHLGLGTDAIDWNKPITPGPLEIGFDECFLIPATGDRVPTVYVANHEVVGLDPDDPISVSFGDPTGDEPTGLKNPELLKMQWDHGHNATIVNGISRIGFMSGGKSARWVDEDMADVLTQQAIRFIDRHVATHAKQPFFLYYNTHDIHVPRAPHSRFVGSTELGPRGDVISELDWSVGEILRTLDQHGLRDNTLVVFTSDNGPVLNDGYKDQAVERNGDHTPSGPFRGGKYSAFEAGTRVPFIARWPRRIAAGTTSTALMCQIDFLASFAALVSEPLPNEVLFDSENHLPALLGESSQGRESLVLQAGVLALREGPWKLIEPGKGPAVSKQVNIETGNSSALQLYKLSEDPGESMNLAKQEPQRAAEMLERLNQIRGRR